jgi:hypothetical protein
MRAFYPFILLLWLRPGSLAAQEQPALTLEEAALK